MKITKAQLSEIIRLYEINTKTELRDLKRGWMSANSDEASNWLTVHAMHAFAASSYQGISMLNQITDFVKACEPYMKHELSGVPVPRDSSATHDVVSKFAIVAFLLEGKITSIYNRDVRSTTFASDPDAIVGGFRGDDHGFVRHPYDKNDRDDIAIEDIASDMISGDELVKYRESLLSNGVTPWNATSAYPESFVANARILALMISADAWLGILNDITKRLRDKTKVELIIQSVSELYEYLRYNNIAIYDTLHESVSGSGHYDLTVNKIDEYQAQTDQFFKLYMKRAVTIGRFKRKLRGEK